MWRPIYPLCLLLSTMPSHYYALGLGGIEQLENAPEYDDLEYEGVSE